MIENSDRRVHYAVLLILESLEFFFQDLYCNSSNLISIIVHGYGTLQGVFAGKKLRAVFYLRVMVVENCFPDQKHWKQLLL